MNHVMDLTPLTVDADISDAEASQIIHEQLETAAIVEQDAEYELQLEAKCRLLALENKANATATQLDLDIWQARQEIIALMTPTRQRYALWRIRQALNDTSKLIPGGSNYSSFSRQMAAFEETWNRSGSEYRRIA